MGTKKHTNETLKFFRVPPGQSAQDPQQTLPQKLVTPTQTLTLRRTLNPEPFYVSPIFCKMKTIGKPNESHKKTIGKQL